MEPAMTVELAMTVTARRDLSCLTQGVMPDVVGHLGESCDSFGGKSVADVAEIGQYVWNWVLL